MDGTSPTTRDESIPVDPWAAQAARRAAATRRRRRWWWFGTSLVVVGVLVALGLRFAGGDEGGASAEPVATSGRAVLAVEVSPQSTLAPSSVPVGAGDEPLTPAEIEEVWLIDRGDGSYDWGARIGSRVADDRGPVAIAATLLDDDGGEVVRVEEHVPALAAGAGATVGGVVSAPAGVSQRVAVDVAVGDPLEEPVPRPDDIRIVAVERRGAAGSDDRPDVVVGRLRSSLGADLVDIRLALVWRGERGEVVAAVFHDVERVRPGIDARFEVPLDDEFAGDGPPSEATWTH